MALTNHERVGKAMDLLKQGLAPFIEREMKSVYKDQARAQAGRLMGGEDRLLADKPLAKWDAAALLKLMWEAWNDLFRRTLGPAERTLVRELQDVRNKLAHQQTFSSDDAYRALDSTGRLLTAVSAPESQEAEKLKMELLRVRFDEQVRTEKRKSAGTAIESQVTGNLKPWREVITPHKDVASGRYQQAEFAADLWQVHVGEGTDEYKNPAEFFRRTYLTESLKRLLVGAVQRLSGKGSDPAPECREAEYEKRLRAAYPIHPEVFDRLYTDWSTLVKFQRTRGVLRLMAAVIHSLWEKGDRNPLILPSNIPIDDPRVQFELTRYLSDNWPAALVAAIALDYGYGFQRVPTRPLATGANGPPVYRELARLPRGPLLELPVSAGDGLRASEYMVHSTTHWMPLLEGTSGYGPASVGVVLQLVRRLPDPRALELLGRMTGLRWVVVHLDRMRPAERERWRDPPGLARRGAFGDDVLFEVASPPSADLVPELRRCARDVAACEPLKAMLAAERATDAQVGGKESRGT